MFAIALRAIVIGDRERDVVHAGRREAQVGWSRDDTIGLVYQALGRNQLLNRRCVKRPSGRVRSLKESAKLPAKLNPVPTGMGAGGMELMATIGSTLSTTRLKPVLTAAPSLSVAVIVTVWVSSGPSGSLKVQLQVPSPLSNTVPTEAVSATVSTPGSENVPLFLRRLVFADRHGGAIGCQVRS